MLKDKLVDAGPDVVAKISEEREQAESRLRSANSRVSELENTVAELQGQLKRAEEDNIKVMDTSWSNYAVLRFFVIEVHVCRCFICVV